VKSDTPFRFYQQSELATGASCTWDLFNSCFYCHVHISFLWSLIQVCGRITEVGNGNGGKGECTHSDGRDTS
jgi:hypothetical protein